MNTAYRLKHIKPCFLWFGRPEILWFEGSTLKNYKKTINTTFNRVVFYWVYTLVRVYKSLIYIMLWLDFML